MRPWALIPFLLVALVPTGAAHGVFEASELEVHLLNDEGSDAIEPYGGYDINEVFLGFAHDNTVGPGAAGDGLYLRAELYGDRANSVPVPGQLWTVSFTFQTPKGPLVRTLSTTDGQTFTSDFDTLLTATDAAERALHVQRAFVSFQHAGVAPGDVVGVTLVESRVAGDLRDVAPGGIPVPGTNGLLFYDDPTAIPGKGLLVKEVVAAAPTGYVAVTTEQPGAGNITFHVQSVLAKGGQHVYVLPRSDTGWGYRLAGTTTAPLGPSGNLTFGLVVDHVGSAPLDLDIFTDVGGRTPVALDPDGTLHVGDQTTPPPAPEGTASSSAIGPPTGLLLVGLAALARRRAA